jgi:hypothetical protein
LDKYEWAFFTDLTPGSFKETVKSIIENYPQSSRSAIKTFTGELNFEAEFKKVKEIIDDVPL